MAVSGKKAVEAKVVEDAPVHNMIRWISKTGAADLERGFWPVSEVDAHVSEWVNKGYSLFNTHYLGEVPEAFGVMYILNKVV